MTTFQDITDELVLSRGATVGRWFGLPCLKIRGKVFAALWEDGRLILKLGGEHHAAALALPGATLFQPMPDRQPMREWVMLPEEFSDQWLTFARASLEYVRELA